MGAVLRFFTSAYFIICDGDAGPVALLLVLQPVDRRRDLAAVRRVSSGAGSPLA